jgi:hypothetical protein
MVSMLGSLPVTFAMPWGMVESTLKSEEPAAAGGGGAGAEALVEQQQSPSPTPSKPQLKHRYSQYQQRFIHQQHYQPQIPNINHNPSTINNSKPTTITLFCPRLLKIVVKRRIIGPLAPEW